jgi:hypothetical protein
MLRIEVTHTFDVSVAEAFAYITDMKNWPEYWPGFIRIENPAAAVWSNPGDRATVVIKLLNRERALNMELEAFEKDASVTYVSRQRGLPDVRHERHFEAARDGCVYRLIVEYEPRTGFAGLFDRTLVRRRRMKLRSVPTRPHVEMTCADYALSEQDLQNDVDFQQARSSSQ